MVSSAPTETILVVGDEPEVLSVAEDMLHMLGYTATIWSHASRKMAMNRLLLMALLAIRTILNPLDLVFGHPRTPRLYRPFESI